VNRALPASLIFHFCFITLLLIFGAHVDNVVIRPQRTISVNLASLPKPQIEEPVVVEEEPEVIPEETPVEVEPEPEIETPVPVPEAKKPEVKVEEKKPEPKPETKPVEKPVEQPVETVTEAPEAKLPETTSISGTDQVVPSKFQYYLTLLEGRVSRHWNPKMLGFRSGSTRVCAIHFYVEKTGVITRETVLTSSGVPLFDREALKAVKAVGRFLPLPAGLDATALGVTYVFTLKSGQ
jgi:periplasmic protein TonB